MTTDDRATTTVEGAATGTGEPTNGGWGAALLAGGFGLLAVVSAFLAVQLFFADDVSEATPRTLAALLIGGLLTFLFGLASVVSVFRALHLSVRKHPLGLPDGSIQAFIALFLILLFFVMSVFLYLNVSATSRDRTLTGLSAEELQQVRTEQQDQIVAVVPRQVAPADSDDGGLETVYDVVIAGPIARSTVADELARQLVTTMGTLIVAIAAFYFGAKSVQEAKSASGGDASPDAGN